MEKANLLAYTMLLVNSMAALNTGHIVLGMIGFVIACAMVAIKIADPIDNDDDFDHLAF